MIKGHITEGAFSKFVRYVKFPGIAAIIFGATVLFIWAFDMVALKNRFPSWISMKPLTALGILLAGLFILWVDVAIRRQVDQALKDVEANYRVIVEQTPAIVYVDEIGGNWRYLSPQAERILGYQPEEWLDQPQLWKSRIHPEDLEKTQKNVEQSRLTGSPLIAEYRFKRKDERMIWLRDEAVVFQEAGSGKTLLQGVILDITDKKQIEEEIHQLNDTLEQRVIERTIELEKEIGEREQAQHELQSALTKTKILYDLAQSSIDSSTSLPVLFQKLVDNVAENLPADRAALITFDHQTQEITHIVRSGPGADQVVLSVSYLELMDGLSGWAIREGRSALSPKDIPDPRESETVQKRRVETNCGAVLVTPLRYQDQVLGTLTVINLPEARNFTSEDAVLLEAITSQAATAIISARLYESLQQANQFLASHTDELEKEISVRSQAERLLVRERDLLQALMDNMPEQIYFKDTASRFTRINRAQAKVLGVDDPEDATGKTDFDFQLRELAETFYLEEQKIIETGEPIIDRVEYNPTAMGKPRWFSATKIPLKNKEGKITGIVGISHDITERVQMQDQLQNSNAQLRRSISEAESRNREILLLSEITSLLESSESIQEAYETLKRSLPRLFPTESGSLFIVSASRNLLESVAQWGGMESASENTFQPSECWAVRLGKVHIVRSAGKDILCRHITNKNTSVIPPYMCIPLMAHGESIGIFHLQYDPENITPAKELLAYTAAEQFSLSFANINLRDTLRSQSIRDPLTGLFNRRYMQESFERELKRAQRNQTHLIVVMLDLDYFKNFNDTFGHAAGDAALRELGKLITNRLRGSDIACRYGGEEFTLILTEVDIQSSIDQIETLRNNVKNMVVEFQGRTLGSFTVSAGVASYPEHGSSAEDLLKAADDALYQAKHAGRDRIVRASPPR